MTKLLFRVQCRDGRRNRSFADGVPKRHFGNEQRCSIVLPLPCGGGVVVGAWLRQLYAHPNAPSTDGQGARGGRLGAKTERPWRRLLVWILAPAVYPGFISTFTRGVSRPLAVYYRSTSFRATSTMKLPARASRPRIMGNRMASRRVTVRWMRFSTGPRRIVASIMGRCSRPPPVLVT